MDKLSVVAICGANGTIPKNCLFTIIRQPMDGSGGKGQECDGCIVMRDPNNQNHAQEAANQNPYRQCTEEPRQLRTVL